MFHGSYKETVELLAAVELSCVEPDKCRKDNGGRVTSMCAAHRALLDQRFLNGLLWVRHKRALIEAEEGLTGAGVQNPT